MKAQRYNSNGASSLQIQTKSAAAAVHSHVVMRYSIFPTKTIATHNIWATSLNLPSISKMAEVKQ